MTEHPADPRESFLTWLLRRVAQAVEPREVPPELLTGRQGESEAAKDRPQEASHAEAIRQIAELAAVSQAQAAEVLASIEAQAQPPVTRELLMRRIAETWLEGQRRAYGKGAVSPGGDA